MFGVIISFTTKSRSNNWGLFNHSFEDIQGAAKLYPEPFEAMHQKATVFTLSALYT